MDSVQEAEKFIGDALIAAIFVSPREPWLTGDDLVALSRKYGIGAGDVSDLLARYQNEWGKYYPSEQLFYSITYYMVAWKPELRNLDAFEKVMQDMRKLASEEGMARAVRMRSELVQRIAKREISENDVEVAITTYVGIGLLKDENSKILLMQKGRSYGLPSDNLPYRKSGTGRDVTRIQRLVSDIKDIMKDRRTEDHTADVEYSDSPAQTSPQPSIFPTNVMEAKTEAEKILTSPSKPIHIAYTASQTAETRRSLNKFLRIDSSLDAFCLDYFPHVYRQFSAGMDRNGKLNLLLSENLDEIRHRLEEAQKETAPL